jgi:hypothetical protein
MDETKKPASGSFSKLMSSPRPTKPAEEKETSPQTDVNAQEDVRVRTHAQEQTSEQVPVEQKLREKILTKRHLSSFTFRFQPEELEALDQVTDELNEHRPQKTSKNDVVRLAVNWLLKDYEENQDGSLLAKVLKRV